MSQIDIKDVNRLAFPAMVASVSEPIINICDSAMIGRFGSDPVTMLAAVGIASSFFLSFIWVFSQTRTAMSTVMSKYYGAGKLQDVRALVPQMILMNFVLGFFIYLVTNLFIGPIFELFDAKGEVLTQAIDYFSIRSIGFPFVLSYLMIFGVFRGIQNTIWAMVITLIAGGINIGLDYIFIHGIDNVIEPMGIKGVALASLTSQLLMFTMAVFYLYWKTRFNLNFLKPIHTEVNSLLGMSGNLIIRSAAVNTAYFFSTRFASGYGESYIAVQHICMNIWFFSAFFIEGYCNAGNALSGKFNGQNNRPALWNLSKIISMNSLKLATGLMLILFIGYYFIGQLFFKDEFVRSIFFEVFWIVLLTLPLMAIAFTYDEMLKGIGKMAYLRNTLLIATLLGFVPTIYLMDFIGFKTHAIWIAFICWMSFRAIRLSGYFNRYYRI
jgi:putative MATE family efflux protein